MLLDLINSEHRKMYPGDNSADGAKPGQEKEW
jgi:hypothetical protein